jgi:gas vesicle protein
MRRLLGFLLGVVLGGLVGSTLALLFAPESGSELRTQIRERFAAFGAEIRQAAATRRIELQQRLDTLRAPRA